MSESPGGELRAAVVGLGPMGIRHLLAWRGLLGSHAVSAVVRHDADRARLSRAGLSDVPELASAAAIVGRAELAIVCVPTPKHADVALPLLQGGVHTLVEKPLAGDLDAARQLAAVEQARCFVAHTCRAEANCDAVIAALAQHSGTREIHSLRAESARPIPPGTPELARHGRLLDVLVHDISAVLELLPPDPPDTITAEWQPILQRLVAELRWREATFDVVEERAAEPPHREVTVAIGATSAGWQVAPGTANAWFDDGELGAKDVPAVWREPVVALAAAVCQALRTGSPSVYDAEHGVRAMLLAAGVLQALPAATFGGAFDWSYVR